MANSGRSSLLLKSPSDGLVFPAGSTTVMPVLVAILMRSKTSGWTSTGTQPNFVYGRSAAWSHEAGRATLLGQG
jgi:hypothetical protein